MYYGVKAKQSDFYVDSSNGSDSNDGTQSSPFRSLEQALKQLDARYTDGYTIHLQENGTYTWDSANVRGISASFTLLPYGNTWDSVTSALSSSGYGISYTAMSDRIVRPSVHIFANAQSLDCLLYTSDAADE